MPTVSQGHDEDEVELYQNYKPGRVRDGKPHPDPIVETSSLAGVAAPEPTYTLSSALQVSRVSPQASRNTQSLFTWHGTCSTILIGNGV